MRCKVGKSKIKNQNAKIKAIETETGSLPSQGHGINTFRR